MKRIFFSLLVMALLTGVTCAGITAAGAQSTVTLPQPCTIVICAVGIVLFRLTHRRRIP